jgi:hypothetical protein
MKTQVLNAISEEMFRRGDRTLDVDGERALGKTRRS